MRDVVLTANSMTVGVRSNRWHHSQQPIDLFISHINIFIDCLAREGWVRFRFQGGISCNGGDKHAHGMGIISEGLHHVENITVEEGVSHDSTLWDILLIVESLELLLGGQFAMDEKESNLSE